MKSTINLEIIRILKWVNANKLTRNTSKFSIVIVPPKINQSVDDSIIVTINSTPVMVVKEVKYIDNKLTFGPHIAHPHMVHVEVKLSRSVGIQLKLKCFTFAFPFETQLMRFFIDIYFIIWFITYKTYTNKITGLQNKAVKLISTSKRTDKCSPIYCIRIQKFC